MKISNAIKKLEKAGFKVVQNRQEYIAKIDGNPYAVEFFKNGTQDDVTCIRVKHRKDKDDVTTDYCAGCFYDNITRAIKAVTYLKSYA